MHVLHYLNRIRLEYGGVVRAVLDMCAYQARAGCEVTLATCDDTDVPASWKRSEPGRPRVVPVGPAPLTPFFAGAFRSRLEPLVRAADAVHLHVIWDPSQLPVAALARAYRKPYIQSPHGMLADWCVAQKRTKKRVYMVAAGERLLRGASAIHLAGEGELEEAGKRHPWTPGVVIPLVFDTSAYLERPSPEAACALYRLPRTDLPRVLFLSRLHYQKRPDLILAAARALRERGMDLQLVFAGPSDGAYLSLLRGYAERLGLLDRCTFTGMVVEQKPSLYAAADLFVLTSTEESFGFVYFEALASGTPVLTTRAAATWRELESSGGARIIDKIRSRVPYGGVGGGHVGAMADAMAGLLSDRVRLRALGQNGREWVLRNLEPGTVARRYLAMYDEAVRRGGRA